MKKREQHQPGRISRTNKKGKGELALQAMASSLAGLALFGLLLFWPAGTFDYWQAWVFIAVFSIVSTVPSIYWMLRRPEVLRRRMNAGPANETRPAQKIASIGAFLSFTAVMVISALDHRFGWSHVHSAVAILGDALVAVGLGIAMLVVQQNSYAAANITVEADQKLVSTGLYGFVRHPMYFGALIMMIGIPPALDSYWGLVVLAPGLFVLAFRITDEEKMLTRELAGYGAYTQQVHYRLMPYVW
jgi:protein-S-isoprenylcysteine O-methyltransferase Ste14